MKGRTLLIILTFITSAQILADESRPLRPVNTYSIVARDAATGQLGVAVQSHWFSVGSGVLWAEPGIGAVATQSFTDPALRAAWTAADARRQVCGRSPGSAGGRR